MKNAEIISAYQLFRMSAFCFCRVSGFQKISRGYRDGGKLFQYLFVRGNEFHLQLTGERHILRVINPNGTLLGCVQDAVRVHPIYGNRCRREIAPCNRRIQRIAFLVMFHSHAAHFREHQFGAMPVRIFAPHRIGLGVEVVRGKEESSHDRGRPPQSFPSLPDRGPRFGQRQARL